MATRTPQHELNELLQAELFHTLGSYGAVAQRLDALDERLGPRNRAPWNTLFPAEVVPRMRCYNEQLRALLHKPATLRDDASRLGAAASPPRHPDPGEDLLGDTIRNQWIVDFHATSVAALKAMDGAPDRRAEGESPERTLGRALQVVHDPQRRGTMASDGRLLRDRIARNGHRLRQVCDKVPSEPRVRAGTILADHLGAPEDEPLLHTHVIGALVEAHLRMHHAEHLTSGSFGDTVIHSAEIYQQRREQLYRSVMLNTFVYVVGRTVPWIFAEDELERDYVLEEFEHCCDTLTPTYCMWISHQLSLLALHRRAYTWALLGQHDRAYNDYDKLKRFIRGLEQRLADRIAQAAGARAFLHGLAGLAEHHSGRIYRSQHAHTAALRHFKRAATRLRQLEREPDMQEVLRNSRWRVSLLMGQAKACYEIGLVKRSLLHYAYAWRAFLELADTENMAKANFEAVDGLIAWLRDVEDDADLNKVELRRRLTPLVEQFMTVLSPAHLRLMAADIIMRLGHLLFVLKLPRPNAQVSRGEPAPTDHELAYKCVLHAARLDASSTLIATDLLKLRREVHGETEVEGERRDLAKVEQQWPAGSSQFEETARVIEFELQTWLDRRLPELRANEAEDPEGALAAELLGAFLVHTDSSNVKLAQVYRYLMQDSDFDPGHDRDTTVPAPSFELVCMRRYSSFFPFLPRPSAFRVLGGGYFLRIPRARGPQPFGIVIDPGPNFTDNLYRCGYCLDDVHMVIVTHDHADHVAALDPILALLGTRQSLGGTMFDVTDRRLAIVGNESVYQRYRFYNAKAPGTGEERSDAVSVFTFQRWADAANGKRRRPSPKHVLRPDDTTLVPVKTVDHTDAHGHLAQGFLLTVGSGRARASLLFIGDAGAASLTVTDEDAARDGCVTLKRALREATVVVAHISSVPVPELRRLAGLDEPPDAETAAMTDRFQTLWEVFEEQTRSGGDETRRTRREFLLKQLQFGFHSRPNDAPAKRPPTLGNDVSPLSPLESIHDPSRRHLYLSGLLGVADLMARDRRDKLLLIGELREELGTFRNRIASALNRHVFEDRAGKTRALTADIGLKVRLTGSDVKVQCTTCDLDNDRVAVERLHAPSEIHEVCVKGEDEGIFYNCTVHDPKRQPEATWLERIERYDPFGR